MFGLFDFCKTSAGLYYSYYKEQYEKCVSDSLQCTVNVHDHIPYRAALKIFRRLCEQSPDLGKLFVPCFQSIIEIIYYPVRNIYPSSLWILRSTVWAVLRYINL